MKKNISYVVITVVALFVGFFVGNVSAGSMKMDHSSMEMNMSDPMQMSMADMGTMLEGKTGDELDKAFLEGMIPHHQGAIEMARTLDNAKNPKLKELGKEIIQAQQAEINQMNEWLVEWGYTKK